jgi:hypothetical protein
VARSTALADFDRDGEVDIALNYMKEDAAVLRNVTRQAGQWLQLALIGIDSNRHSVGTRLLLEIGDRIQVRSIQAGTGYLSSDEATMLIGLGSQDELRTLTAVWPSGRREVWSGLQAGRLWRLVEGTGQDAGAAP